MCWQYAVYSFFFNDTATTEIYTLSLHDALPILAEYDNVSMNISMIMSGIDPQSKKFTEPRSEEHTSELQSQFHLVCRLLLEKKKQIRYYTSSTSLHRNRPPIPSAA